MLIRVGKEEAKKSTKHRIVANTLRFLAKSGRTERSISRKAAALLDIRKTSAALSDAFQNSDIRVLEFVDALEGAVRGEVATCRRATEIAAAVAPGLSVRRGPKVSEITHELLLKYVANTPGPKSYTSNPVSGDVSGPLTCATRLEFGHPTFDPRPAFRRHKLRLQQKSN